MITRGGAVVKYDAAGTRLYNSGNTVPVLDYTQLAYGRNGTLFFSVRINAPATYKVVDTGSALISTKISDYGYDGQVLLTAAGNVIIGTVDGVVCMTPDGATVWLNSSLIPRAPAWNLSLDMETNTLYVYTNTYLYALDAGTGKTVNYTYLGFVDPYGSNAVFSTATVGSKYLYLGTPAGLVACTKDTKVAWINREVGSCVEAMPAYNAELDIVYIGTFLYMLVGVNGTTGATIFNVGTIIPPSPGYFNEFSSAIIDAAGSVYIYSDLATDLGPLGMFKFSATGVLDSSEPLVTYFTLFSIGPNGKLYLGTANGLQITV